MGYGFGFIYIPKKKSRSALTYSVFEISVLQIWGVASHLPTSLHVFSSPQINNTNTNNNNNCPAQVKFKQSAGELLLVFLLTLVYLGTITGSVLPR